MIKNVSTKSIADELVPLRPTKITRGYFPQRITINTVETEDEAIQLKYDSLKPPFLQRLIHKFGVGFIWE